MSALPMPPPSLDALERHLWFADRLRHAGVESPQRASTDDLAQLYRQTHRQQNGNLAVIEGGRNRRIQWTNLGAIEMKAIRFADKPMWQHAAFHLVVGRKNSGKGTALADVAARVTRGELGDKRQVLWIANGEDSYAIDVKPRIVAAGGDPTLVTVATSGRVRLPDDAQEIERQAHELGSVGLIVIDPLGGSLTSGKSSNHDGDVRPAIDPLNDVADSLDCMLVGVRHITNKEIKGDALAGVLGSSDWVNVPRCVIALAHDADEDDVRHMQVVAGNRARQAGGRSFRIEGCLLPGLEEEVTRVVWLGESGKDVSDLLSAPRRTSRSGEAREKIIELLTSGRMESDQLDAAVAQATGLAARTVRDVRTQLRKDRIVRSFPEKDSAGTVVRWLVELTNAAPRVVSRGAPDVQTRIERPES